MKKTTLLIFLVLVTTALFSQHIDTLNRLDDQNKKTGYWICYLDSNLNITEKDKSHYYGYEFYLKGKKQTVQFNSESWRKKMTVRYEPFDKEKNENPILLNGTVRYFYKDSMSSMEVYADGLPQYWEENFMSMDKGVMTGVDYVEKYYFDSLYNKEPFTLLRYNIEKEVVISKQYLGRNLKTDAIYLVPHKTLKSIDRPRIGYTFQQRSFLEIGYSKKYSKVTKISDRGMHFDNNHFPGFTLSVLGSWNNKKGNYFGQKALFTYAAFFVNTEAGFLNYTDFHQNDLRFTIGAGPSFMGRISLMYHYSHPLLNNQFGNIVRHSVSLILY